MKHSLLIPTTLIGVTLIGGAGLQFARSNAASGGSTTAESAAATTGEDGTITVTGVTLPGQGVSTPAACEAETTQTAKVVCAAEAFLGTLSEDQQTEVLLPLTQENAVRWSNFPSPFGERNGIQFSTLDDTQLNAALAVVKTSLGTLENEGYSEAMQIRMADDVVALFDDGGGPGGQSGGAMGGPPDGVDNGSGGPGDGSRGPGGGAGGGAVSFSSGSYYLAFLGTPSTTDTWILQFGGHHLASNTTYKGGKVASATPYHTGVEPTAWTTKEASYAPLNGDHEGLVAMLASLSDEQLTSAQLSETFSDILVGPGEDGQFPATKVGLPVSDLNDEQRALVLAAMKPWVQDADAATAAELLAIYEQELDETYISFSGDASLSNLADYARIDGPSVWIELASQGSDIDPTGIHYHTIWRDHERDYGAEYNF